MTMWLPPGRRIRFATSWMWRASGWSLDWEKYVEIDPRYFRPTEVDYLLGNPRKAVDRFGWKPEVSFKQLVEMMVDNDLALAEREMMLRQAGHQVVSR